MPDRTPTPLRWCDRQLGRLAGLFAVVGALGMLGLLGVTVIAVIWRYVLSAPIYGIEDLSVVLLTLAVAGAVAYGARFDAHVSINIIAGLMPRGVTRITDALMRAGAAGIAGLAAWGLVKKACGIERGCITANLGIEHVPFYYVLSASLGFVALHYAVQLLIGLAHWSGRDPNEPVI